MKSTINGTTTTFVGAHYEMTGSTVTKYYFAGAQRVAVRTGSTLRYLLGDHLGSTSIVTNTSGTKVMETRYKPWGEVRYATASQTLPTRYTFTGQYSYINDEATDLGSASFGLMFYNARWMDPYTGRFIQADSMIPGGVQGLDRYAYVNNSPVNYTDPSGHMCIDDNDNPTLCQKEVFGHGRPEWLDRSNLTDSGQKAYDIYLELFYNFDGYWWTNPNLGGDGKFTVADFVTMILFEESNSSSGAPYFGLWTETNVRGFYQWMKGQEARFTSGSAGLLNYMWGTSGRDTRTAASFDGGPNSSVEIPALQGVVNAMLNPASANHPEWADGCVDSRPCYMGSYNQGSTKKLKYIETFRKERCEPSFAVFPSCGASDFVFFLTSDEANIWASITDEK